MRVGVLFDPVEVRTLTPARAQSKSVSRPPPPLASAPRSPPPDSELADKLANLTDLTTDVPVGWTTARVQEYFVWAKR